MSMSTGMEQRAALSQVQRISQRLEQAQKFGGLLDAVTDGFGFSPAVGYELAVARFDKLIGRGEIGAEVIALLRNQHSRACLLRAPMTGAHPTQKLLREFLVDRIWSEANGSFQIGDTEPVQVSGAVLRGAMIDPKGLDADMELIRSMMQAGSGNSSAQLMHLKEKQVARVVADILRPECERAELLLRSLLGRNGVSGDNPVREFFRDMLVRREFLPILSERILRRASEAVLRTQRREEHLELVLLNTVATFTLVAVGAVEPGLFQLHRGVIADADFNEAKRNLALQGVNLDDFLRHHRLTAPGPFFFNRWALRGAPLDKQSDSWVRTFITATVREDRKIILAALDAPRLMPALQALVTDRSIDPNERRAAIREAIVEAIGSEQFTQGILRLMRDSWFTHLRSFLSPASISTTNG
jgi:hypothetical protein